MNTPLSCVTQAEQVCSWLWVGVFVAVTVVFFTRRLTHAATAHVSGQVHTAALATQTTLPALFSTSHRKLDLGLVPLDPAQQDSPSSWVLSALSSEADELAGMKCRRRRTSLEQQLLGLLLPKPTYSTLPQYCGRKMVFVAAKEPNTYQVIAKLLDSHPEFLMASAKTGEDALEQLGHLPFLPNAVLLAKQLPCGNGDEVCRIIRKAYTPVQLPVIMLLPRDAPHDAIEACMEAGASDCIIKPIGQAELLARLNTHIMLPQLAAADADRAVNYRLLQAMLPPRIIERLKTGSKVIAEQHKQVTILFSDIVSFTSMSHELPTEFIINMLEELFSEFDACCDKHGVYKVETIGDAYMCVAGHEGERDDHALRMLMMAQSMLEATERVGKLIGRDLQIRVGVHTGPAYSGVVGKKCPRYCFFGDTVNTASRMESSSFPMCVHFSQATKASLDRAWMLRSYRESSADDDDDDGDERNNRGERKPESVTLGARYQKGRGLVASHLLKVGAYRAAVMGLGLPDPDAADSPGPSRDMHSALLKASAAAVASSLQSQAKKALKSGSFYDSSTRSSFESSIRTSLSLSDSSNFSPFRPRDSLDVSMWRLPASGPPSPHAKPSATQTQ